jgi:polysaccharide pyruvyl transferase WcaK-like protein
MRKILKLNNNKINLLIFGSYGFKNIGTEAILDGIINRFTKNNKNNSITIVSNDLNYSSFIHNYSFISKFSFSFIKSFFLSNIIILGGDELINDDYYNNYHYDQKYKNKFNLYEGKLLYLLLIFSKIFNKKIILYSIGVNKIKNKLTKFLIKNLFPLANHITVRDNFSENNLKKIGIKNTLLIKDPSIDMMPISKKKLKQILTNENLDGNKYVVITLKNDKNFNSFSLNLLVKIANWIISKYNYKIILIPCSNHPYNLYEQDLIILNKFYKKIVNKKMVKIIKKNYHPKIIEGIISKSSLIIGMRMHPIIFANKFNVPNICIPYSKKHKYVLKSLNFTSKFIKNNVNEIDFQNIIKKTIK